MKCTDGRRVALAVATALALTGTAACTSSESSDTPRKDRGTSARSLAALRSAERSMARAASARVRSTTVMGSRLSIAADGALGWGDGLTGTFTLRYTGGTTAESLRALGITSMEARYLPDAYYARMSEAFAEKTDGKHWIKYVYDDLEALGGGVDFADQMRNTTPNQSVKLLLESGDVRNVGREKIAGRTATHYSGTVSVGDVADAQLKKQLQQAQVTTETVDIWVDDRNLLIKKVEKGRTGSGELTQTAYYSDYGVHVTAAKPPAADTEDFRDLLARQSTQTP